MLQQRPQPHGNSDQAPFGVSCGQAPIPAQGTNRNRRPRPPGTGWAAYIPAAGRSASVSVGGPGPAPALALATAPPPRRGAEAASQGQQPPAMAAPVLSTGPMPGPAVISIWVHIYSYLITMWPYLCPLNSSHCTTLVRHTTCTMVQHNIPHHTVLIITVLPIHQLPALSTHAFLICWWHAGPLPMHVVSTYHIVYSHGPCNT